MRTIDLTPTWRDLVPALLALANNPATRQDALDELAKMARAADLYVDAVKRGELTHSKGATPVEA